MFDFLTGLVAFASSVPTIDWSNIITGDTFAPLLSGIATVLPIVIPIGVGIAAIPVIIKLVKKNMKG